MASTPISDPRPAGAPRFRVCTLSEGSNPAARQPQPFEFAPETVGQVQTWLGALSAKWAMRVLEPLADGPLRYNGLLERAAPISAKVLTHTLRRLETAGVIERRRVGRMGWRYGLTAEGAALLDHTVGLCRWLEGRQQSRVEHLSRSEVG